MIVFTLTNGRSNMVHNQGRSADQQSGMRRTASQASLATICCLRIERVAAPPPAFFKP
jgi:hypothetical protein